MFRHGETVQDICDGTGREPRTPVLESCFHTGNTGRTSEVPIDERRLRGITSNPYCAIPATDRFVFVPGEPPKDFNHLCTYILYICVCILLRLLTRGSQRHPSVYRVVSCVNRSVSGRQGRGAVILSGRERRSAGPRTVLRPGHDVRDTRICRKRPPSPRVTVYPCVSSEWCKEVYVYCFVELIVFMPV